MSRFRIARGPNAASPILILIGVAGLLILAACSNGSAADQPVSSDQSQQPGPTGTGTEVVGVVTDESGKPLPEVGIAITKGTSATPEILVLTDENGKYTWKVPAGSYTLMAHLDDYQSESKDVQVSPGAQAKLDFQLKKLP